MTRTKIQPKSINIKYWCLLAEGSSKFAQHLSGNQQPTGTFSKRYENFVYCQAKRALIVFR
jgi:hypothetical protein